MMPSFCPADSPPGESALFAELASSPATDDWIVLHSLAIAQHIRQVEGEADFVVLIPNEGVLVVEVKSHRSLQVLDDGRWKLGTSAPTTRSPFQQAREAMYSIRNHAIQRWPDARQVPFGFAVWFTHLRTAGKVPASPEWHTWQLLDRDDRDDAATALKETMQASRTHLESRVPGTSVGATNFSKQRSQVLADTLRPRFELVVSQNDARKQRSSDLIAYLDEQYEALDAMAANTGVLFTGPAGSGKTLLALEATRREVAKGGRGQLLCFNSLLGSQLRSAVAGLAEVQAGTIHQAMLEVSQISIPRDASARFWDRELPEIAVDNLLSSNHETFDFLVIDEFQDLAHGPFLDFVDLLVDGGLRHGRILLFADFDGQRIFGGQDETELRSRRPTVASYRLTANCRNLPRIGYLVNTFSGLEPGYQRFRRPDDGVDPEFRSYSDESQQSDLLADAIRALKAEGYDLGEITVLSVRTMNSTADRTDDSWLRQILAPATGSKPRPGSVPYSTIHAFKGLESPAIVLTDLAAHNVPNLESLLYVGMTRATDRLVALIESGTLQNMLRKGGS